MDTETPITETCTPLEEIEALAESYRDNLDHLTTLVDDLEASLRSVRAARLPAIRQLAVFVRAARADLADAVALHGDLFERPRTRVLHGIRVGYAKSPGRVAFADATQVVRLIHHHLPAKADSLIKTTETPLRNALAQLTVPELRILGCTLAETGDQVVVKPQDSDVEKIVQALLKEE